MNRCKHSSAVLLFATTMVALGGAGCTRDVETVASSPAEPGVVAPVVAPVVAAEAVAPQAATLAMRDGTRSLFNPIHAGVAVRDEDGGAKVAYTRTRGKPFGVAYMLDANALEACNAITVAITTQPTLRPQLCLTDAAGNIWNAPATNDGGAVELRFDLTRVQPDPFQNGGRTLPAKPDMTTMRMLTILDISGFMGGAETPCEWTISRLELHRSDASNVKDAGGGQ